MISVVPYFSSGRLRIYHKYVIVITHTTYSSSIAESKRIYIRYIAAALQGFVYATIGCSLQKNKFVT